VEHRVAWAIVTMMAAVMVAPDRPIAQAQGQGTDLSGALDAISTAVCDRAERCGEMGRGRAFTDRDACMHGVMAAEQAELNAASCPSGPDPATLQQCTDDIHRLECESVVPGPTAAPSCRPTRLCLH
jgi:hypothetical protein